MIAPVSTRHQTFAEWTVAGEPHLAATDDVVWDGKFWPGLLADDAKLSERWIEETAAGNTITLSVVDRRSDSAILLDEFDSPLLDESDSPLLTESPAYASLAVGAVEGTEIRISTLTTVAWSDGSETEHLRQAQLTVVGREFAPGLVRVQLTDLEDARLNTLYPPRTYTADDWPALTDADAGRTVPRVFGTALKIPAIPVSTASPYRYVLLDTTDAGAVSVLTVYRGRGVQDQRVVEPEEYTVGSALTPWPHLWIEFEREQRGFDGAPYTITADVSVDGADVQADVVLQQPQTILHMLA